MSGDGHGLRGDRRKALQDQIIARRTEQRDIADAECEVAVDRAERAEVERNMARTEVERLTSERDAWIDRYETSHASRLHAENSNRFNDDRAAVAEAERDDLLGRLSELLWNLTDGKLSKANYPVRTMVQEVEATFEGYSYEAQYDTLHAAVTQLADELTEEIDELRGELPPKGAVRVAHIYRIAGMSEARDRLKAALLTEGGES